MFYPYKNELCVVHIVLFVYYLLSLRYWRHIIRTVNVVVHSTSINFDMTHGLYRMWNLASISRPLPKICISRCESTVKGWSYHRVPSRCTCCHRKNRERRPEQFRIRHVTTSWQNHVRTLFWRAVTATTCFRSPTPDRTSTFHISRLHNDVFISSDS